MEVIAYLFDNADGLRVEPSAFFDRMAQQRDVAPKLAPYICVGAVLFYAGDVSASVLKGRENLPNGFLLKIPLCCVKIGKK